jgi:predicted TPR repeat methyltransferase
MTDIATARRISPNHEGEDSPMDIRPDPKPDDSDREVTVDEALAYGLELIGQREFDAASTVFHRILAVAPEHPGALNFLGIVSYHTGRRKEALEFVGRAAAAAPDHAGIQNNLGNMLIEGGNVDGAIEAYKRSLEIDPAQPEPLNNLASILKARHDYADAEQLLRHALTLDAKHGPAHHNLGEVLVRTGRPKEAIDHFWHAALLMPQEEFNPYFIALAYDRVGQRAAAVEILQEWLEKDPDNVQARHLLSGFSGKEVPQRASNAFVETIFDRFANSFESQLAKLEYKAPKLVTAAFEAVVGAPQGQLAILDAGCGTGLCAPLLRPHAGHLSGVDLSAGMLEKAAATELYDRLTKGELTAFIAANEGAYDAIISADTLCYFGGLEAFAAAAAAAIRPGGVLVFTVEALDESADKDHHLNTSGRYSHAGPYLDRVFGDAGFEIVERKSEVLRLENLEPVAGFVFTARRP